MKVKAKRLGYYDHRRRREGEVFELVARTTKKGEAISPEKQYSSKWMEKLSSNGAETAEKAPAKPSEPKGKSKAKSKGKSKGKNVI